MKNTRGFYKDLVGKKFGHLLITKWAGQDKRGKSLWEVRCDCGNVKKVVSHALTSLRTKSCGCARREYMKVALGKEVGQLTGAKWSAIVFNARARQHEVLITQSDAADLFEIQKGLCALSGIELILDAPRAQITASLDRIDSSKGYVLGNIQWIHKDINKMKNDMDEKTFRMWIDRIYHHRSGDKETLVAPSVSST